MRCYLCGRSLKRAAATTTITESNPPVTVVGYAGKVCARKAGLLQRLAKVQATVKAQP